MMYDDEDGFDFEDDDILECGEPYGDEDTSFCELEFGHSGDHRCGTVSWKNTDDDFDFDI